MRAFLLLLAISFTFAYAEAQQRIPKLREATELHKKEKYAEALEIFENLMSTSAGQGVMGVDAKINMADCYRRTDQIGKAKPLYKELLPYVDERPDILLGYGEALLATGSYDEARGNFIRYSEKRPDDPKGKALAKRCDDIQSIRPIYDNVTLTYETSVNDSISDELAPAFYGSGIVFASDRVQKADLASTWGEKEKAYLNLYFCEISPDRHLMTPNPFSRKLNSPIRHDGPATFSRDGKTIYYSQSVKSDINPDKYFLQIFVSHLEDGDWNTPLVLEFVTQGYMFTHPCLSPNGMDLYFVSDMKGGYGGMDIWVSRFQNGRWGAPKNLGPGINTDRNEAFPFMHPNGTLYFASKGHASYGGLDIFRSRPTGNGVDWTKAENLGQPFNTAFDDSYFLLSDDQTSGFLASAREKSDNIYSFVIVGAEAQPLPDGIMVRGGNGANFIDTLGGLTAKIDDEALVDSLLKSGFTINKDPKKTTTPKVDSAKNNVTNPDVLNDSNDNGDIVENNKTNPNSKDNNKAVNNNTKTNTTTNPNSKDKTDPNFSNNKGNDYVEKPYDANNDWANGDPNNTPPINESKFTGEMPTLAVKLSIIDEVSNKGIKGAKVTLRNTYSGAEKTFETDADGLVIMSLEPDQKYLLRAESNGYFGGSLPLATMGAYQSQTVGAKLPLIKK